MDIKLIPVIEIFRSSDKIKTPEKGPYWEYAKEWEEYNRECLKANGFSEIEPYIKGSSFYELSKISDNDLLLQIKYRTDDWEIDEICPFDGGYILNVDNKDLLFPQCCSDLGDIENWIELSKGNNLSFWQGHPWPIIKQEEDKITFNLTVNGFDEHFVPTPLKEKFEIDQVVLKKAINNLIVQLGQFAVKLNDINHKERLGFENIAKILIWEKI